MLSSGVTITSNFSLIYPPAPTPILLYNVQTNRYSLSDMYRPNAFVKVDGKERLVMHVFLTGSVPTKKMLATFQMSVFVETTPLMKKVCTNGGDYSNLTSTHFHVGLCGNHLLTNLHGGGHDHFGGQADFAVS